MGDCVTLGAEGVLVLGGFIAEIEPRGLAAGTIWGGALAALARAIFLRLPSDVELSAAAGHARLPRGGCLSVAICAGQLTSFP